MDVKTMHFEPAEENRYCLVRGDVLVSEASGSRARVGTTALWTGALDHVMFQNTLLRLRPRPGTDARYLYWWSRYAYGSGIYARAAQGLAIWHLSAERLRAVPFPGLGLENQRRVAAFLDEQIGLLDRAFNLRQVQAELFEVRIQAKLTECLAPQQRDDWVALRRLGVGITTGPFGTVFSAEDYVSGGIPMINPTHIRTGELVPDPHVGISRQRVRELRRYALRSGDLVVSRKGDIGQSALVTPESEGWICGSDSIALRLAKSALVPAFGWHLMRLVAIREQLVVQSVGATMPNLNEPNLLKLRVPFFPVEEQERLAERANRLVSQYKAADTLLVRSANLLQERKQALITAAVTGQFDVTTARSVA